MNKIIQIEADKEQADHITSYTKLINNLVKNSYTKDVINGYSFFTGKMYSGDDRLKII